MTYLVLRLVHIAAMAAWFGAVIFTSGDVRRTIASGTEDLSLLQTRLKRSGVVAGVSALVTLVTGVALIFVMGGFGAVPPAIHGGLLMGLVAWAIGAFGIGGGVRKLDAAIVAGETRAALAPVAKRISIAAAAFHATWFVTLVLMVFRGVIGR